MKSNPMEAVAVVRMKRSHRMADNNDYMSVARERESDSQQNIIIDTRFECLTAVPTRYPSYFR